MNRPRLRRSGRIVMWWLPAFAAAGLGWVLVPSSAPTAVSTAASRQARPANTTSGPSAVDGSRAYVQYCASCHGAEGLGTDRAPSLKGVGMAEVDFQLQTGRMPKRSTAPKPPPYTPILPQSVIAALNQYVTALVAHGGPPIPTVNPAAGDVAQGGEVFREYCAACHSSVGIGGALVDRPIPAVIEATPTEVGEAVRAGAAQMPAFGTAAIPPKDVNAIAAYIQYLKHPTDKGGNPLSHVGPVAEGLVTWFIAMLVLLGFIRWIGQRG